MPGVQWNASTFHWTVPLCRKVTGLMICIFVCLLILFFLVVFYLAAPSSEMPDSEIVFENEKEKELRDKQVLHSFGSNEQPKLQKIEYKVRHSFNKSFESCFFFNICVTMTCL